MEQNAIHFFSRETNTNRKRKRKRKINSKRASNEDDLWEENRISGKAGGGENRRRVDEAEGSKLLYQS